MIRSFRRIFEFRYIINVLAPSLVSAMFYPQNKHKNNIEKLWLLKFLGADDTELMVFSNRVKSPEERRSMASSRVTHSPHTRSIDNQTPEVRCKISLHQTPEQMKYT